MCTSPLPAFRYAESSAPGRDCFDRWVERVSPLWSIDGHPDAIARFQWSGTTLHLGRAILSDIRSGAHSMRRDTALIGRMGIDHIIVLIRRARRCSLQPAGEILDIDPGDLCFLDLSRPMWADVPDLDCITITIPRAVLAPLVRDADALHGLVVPAKTPMAKLAMAHLEALVRNAADLDPAEMPMVLRSTAALLAACTACALADTEGTRIAARPAVMLTLRRHVEQHLSDATLDAANMARQFGLSRSTIYRLFQPLGGVATYIRRRRLLAARAMLTDAADTRRVYQIADLFHLGSDSSFSHTFRREFGLSPRDLRALVASGTAPSALCVSGSALYDWFIELS